jgi:hypothetical protein
MRQQKQPRKLGLHTKHTLTSMDACGNKGAMSRKTNQRGLSGVHRCRK